MRPRAREEIAQREPFRQQQGVPLQHSYFAGTVVCGQSLLRNARRPYSAKMTASAMIIPFSCSPPSLPLTVS